MATEIDMTFKRVDNNNRICLPNEWVKDLEKSILFMYSEESKEQAVLIQEDSYRNLEINPSVTVETPITTNGYLTIKKKIRNKLQIEPNDILHLTYNKKLKIIIFIKVKVQKIEREFEQEFAQLSKKFFSDPVIRNNIKIIEKMDNQRKKSDEQ